MLNLTKPGFLFEREKLFQVNDKLINKSADANFYKVAFVFNHPEQQLPAPLKEMADKLVTACKFKPEEVIYINQNAGHYLSLNELTSQFNIKFVLAFGNVVLSRNLNKLTRHLPYNFGQLKILQTDSLESLEKNSVAKKILWAALASTLELK